MYGIFFSSKQITCQPELSEVVLENMHTVTHMQDKSYIYEEESVLDLFLLQPHFQKNNSWVL